MKVKAIIQNHYLERVGNIYKMRDDLIAQGIKDDDVIVMTDNKDIPYPFYWNTIVSKGPMPIGWWHGIGALLECDYVALLCDDLTLKKDSISELVKAGEKYGNIDVFGYEGGDFAKTELPYTDAVSHLVTEFTKAEYMIRFYFARPIALARATRLYNSRIPKQFLSHDDLVLSLANNCGLIPTSATSGWDELNAYYVGYSHRTSHYYERNGLINSYRKLCAR
jgi:hypothetical protein